MVYLETSPPVFKGVVALPSSKTLTNHFQKFHVTGHILRHIIYLCLSSTMHTHTRIRTSGCYLLLTKDLYLDPFSHTPSGVVRVHRYTTVHKLPIRKMEQKHEVEKARRNFSFVFFFGAEILMFVLTLRLFVLNDCLFVFPLRDDRLTPEKRQASGAQARRNIDRLNCTISLCQQPVVK